MKLTLKVWRQKNSKAKGALETYQVEASEHMSFLEMMDVLNDPVVKDLTVDRSAFDRIIQSGGYINVNTGQAPDGNAIPIEKELASNAFDAAACIGCGACVAACPNGSAMLFTSAKVSHLNQLPQGEVEKTRRTASMVAQMDKEGFGMCSNVGACEAECPKEISIEHIARMNRDYVASIFGGRKS